MISILRVAIILAAFIPSVLAQGIFEAVKAGDLNWVRTYVEADPACVNLKDDHWYTPLHRAVKSVNVAELLLSAGAEINAKDNRGFTPLHWAAQNGNLEAATMLLPRGAAVNAKDHVGLTPLHFAKRGHDSESLQSLLAQNPQSLNEQNGDRDTLLHWAVRGENQITFEFLLSQGADATIKNKVHISAAELANGLGLTKMVAALQRRESKEQEERLKNRTAQEAHIAEDRKSKSAWRPWTALNSGKNPWLCYDCMLWLCA
jgi:ankyrin repeat protein